MKATLIQDWSVAAIVLLMLSTDLCQHCMPVHACTGSCAYDMCCETLCVCGHIPNSCTVDRPSHMHYQLSQPHQNCRWHLHASSARVTLALLGSSDTGIWLHVVQLSKLLAIRHNCGSASEVPGASPPCCTASHVEQAWRLTSAMVLTGSVAVKDCHAGVRRMRQARSLSVGGGRQPHMVCSTY
ncbi:hypothetical protein COO60DRAFT_1021916 [Scenedesmus sp. NREL 46B-D3]|nr:hypothetical protein COO60DRAFT_1021916 [Scenedesmus sp. NREL 46B-D3]